MFPNTQSVKNGTAISDDTSCHADIPLVHYLLTGSSNFSSGKCVNEQRSLYKMSHQDKKDEGDSVGKAFKNLDKTTLIQEARCFNSTPVNPRKCIHILTKIIYLLNQGETLTREEATNLFFATTKLFQSNDILLRRLLHLCIKELSPIAEDVIIVTSSLTKDMIGKEVLYRASAMRALCTLTDITILQGIERYMKQSILDQNPAVSSAALVSALHLSATYPDLVRRCVPEAQVNNFYFYSEYRQ